MKKPTVFISYSQSGSQFVAWLVDKLKASGAEIWIDKWMSKVGDSITQKINEGIGALDSLIAVLSRASVNSTGVREELNAATIGNVEEERCAFTPPVLIEECQIPMLLQHRKNANFTDDPEQAFQDLLETLRPESRILDRPPFELEMVLIPAGEFLMGSDARKDKRAFEDEQPQHTLYLPEYFLAKTSVTNTQYAAFVGATGYRTAAEEEGWAWVWTGSQWRRVRGADWQHPHGRKSDVDEKGDHPVVQISWHDALAFCQWLSQETDKPFRLPSEAEWEKAARGTDGRIYPWGNRWDAMKCNTCVGGKGDATPVGVYPQGASPYGLLDIAGNVWEWTRSLWGKDRQVPEFKYPYNPADGREKLDAPGDVFRVQRGGSWTNSWWQVRCAFCRTDLPLARCNLTGFRVMVASGSL